MDLRESVSVTTPSEVVEFDKLTPTTVGVVFNPNTPATTDILYVSTVNASTWIYNGSSYITYTAATLPNTPFYLTGTTIDAGGNKTASIQHLGQIRATSFTGSGGNITSLNATNLATGTVNTARLGSGAVGAGDKYLADNNTWKTIASGGKIGIPNQTTGIFTYYSTLETARDAASSGDIIFVYPGTYTVTTTAANGLSKDGVSWYFYPNAITSKSTTGPLFRNNAFTSGTNVYGFGEFTCSVSATNVYLIEGDRQNVDNTFEFASATCSTSSSVIKTNCTAGTFNSLNTTKIKGNKVYNSSTGKGVEFAGTGLLFDIEIANVYAVGAEGIYNNATNSVGKIRTINIKSGSTHAVSCTAGSYNSRISFEGVSYIPGGSGVSFSLAGDTYHDVSYYNISSPSGMPDVLASGDKIMTITIGSGVTVNSSILWSKATLNGNAEWNNGSLNGSATYLVLQGGVFTGEVTGYLQQTGGRFEGVVRYSGRGDYSGSAISGGVAIIREFGHKYNALSISGTANVTLYNYYTGGNSDLNYNGSIDLSAGTLRVMGIIRNNSTLNTGSGSFPCINWTGGTLILHSSAVFYCASTDSAAIKATGSRTGKIYGKVVSNTADTGTITWQVGTGSDRVVDTNVL